MKLLSEVVEGGGTAKVGEARTGGGELRLLEALEQGIGGAQVLQNDGAWAAVHAAGLDEVVVGAAVDDFALDAGHNI
ncbi:MAG TPA: hypothetical protein VJ255_18800 [Candidatus Acidoferrum sp.]|nr:hypothetical protein [Candidatus Acidoferrum sp.]